MYKLFFDKLVMKNSINKYISSAFPLFQSDENSREGLNVPYIALKYAKTNLMLSSRIKEIKPTMIKTIREMRRSYHSIKTNPVNFKKQINEDELKRLKAVIESLGITEYAFAEVEKDMVFKNQSILFSHAIVLLMEMDQESIDKAPSLETGKEVFNAYYKLGKAVNVIAQSLKDMGFAVQAGPALGGDVIYPVLAQKSGLGHVGKNGLLINRKFGPRLRIAAVYTSIENFKIISGNEYDWISKFCDKCNACVRTCPSKAIYKDPIITDLGYETHIDYKKCAIPFAMDYGCSVCIKECTFNHTDYETVKELMK